MGWFSDFRWFIRDMYRQWVGKMTATLSIILAVAPLVFPEFFAGDKGLLRAQWVWWGASAAAFLVAARSAWGEERSKRLSAEEKLSQAVKALEDNIPKLSLSANAVEGPKEWRESPVPLAFTIHHLSGRVPTSLYFDPIPSKNGKFLLQLNSLPHVSQNGFEGLGFDIVELGAPALSAADRETTKRYIHKELLNMFLDDAHNNCSNWITKRRFTSKTEKWIAHSHSGSLSTKRGSRFCAVLRFRNCRQLLMLRRHSYQRLRESLPKLSTTSNHLDARLFFTHQIDTAQRTDVPQ